MHQYCYNIPEVPTSDFYCDVCAFMNIKKKTSASRHRRHIPKEKPTGRVIPPEIYCRICLMNEFPLKRMKKLEWYHITCLMLHDIGSQFETCLTVQFIIKEGSSQSSKRRTIC